MPEKADPHDGVNTRKGFFLHMGKDKILHTLHQINMGFIHRCSSSGYQYAIKEENHLEPDGQISRMAAAG